MARKPEKYDERCPFCGRYIERDADGWYDCEDRNDDDSPVHCFCTEECADKFHANKASMRGLSVFQAALSEAGL